MKTQTTKKPNQNSSDVPSLLENEIRDYAFHLYEEGGHRHGLDVEYWHEARACLNANIPKESARMRMHHHAQITERAVLPIIKHGKS